MILSHLSPFSLLSLQNFPGLRVLYAANQTVATLAGAQNMFGHVDGPGPSARFSQGTYGLALHPSSAPHALVYMTDSNNNRIRVYNASSGLVSTFAGSTNGILSPGQLSTASFPSPVALAFLPNGDLLVLTSVSFGATDTYILRIHGNSWLSVVAGTGLQATTDMDGPALSTPLRSPQFILPVPGDINGQALFTDGHAVRMLALPSPPTPLPPPMPPASTFLVAHWPFDYDANSDAGLQGMNGTIVGPTNFLGGYGFPALAIAR